MLKNINNIIIKNITIQINNILFTINENILL